MCFIYAPVTVFVINCRIIVLNGCNSIIMTQGMRYVNVIEILYMIAIKLIIFGIELCVLIIWFDVNINYSL